ncbi:nipblb [Symbiodinium necroappetens]|uniref:Nipblb protein n=1 Tax=Symbiodinium necroappetens TaxID=1628268 RepID=A0A812T323_9DINO|nr:nipblb [Symbiodinium necroappetens]
MSRMGCESQCLYGPWKELESSNIYNVTSADWDNPYLRNLTVVNNPAKDDRRDFEIQMGDHGRLILCPMYHKDIAIGTESNYNLYADYSIPGRIVWHSPTTGRIRTWQSTLHIWNTTLVQLMGEVEGDVLRLCMRKLTGELISNVTMQRSTRWKEARKLMIPGLRPLLSKKLAFVSSPGEVLTPAHDEKTLSELLGCMKGEPELVEEWRRFQ